MLRFRFILFFLPLSLPICFPISCLYSFLFVSLFMYTCFCPLFPTLYLSFYPFLYLSLYSSLFFSPIPVSLCLFTLFHFTSFYFALFPFWFAFWNLMCPFEERNKPIWFCFRVSSFSLYSKTNGATYVPLIQNLQKSDFEYVSISISDITRKWTYRIVKFQDGAYILIVNIVDHVTRFPLVVHSLPLSAPQLLFPQVKPRLIYC